MCNDFEEEYVVINNSIKDLDCKIELNDKKFIKTTNLGENINYYIPDGDLLIFSQLNNIKQINYCSKNVFNKDYYRTYSSSITTNTGVSLTASKDDGKITIYGEWFAGNA